MQNGHVLHICSACGAVNSEENRVCAFCESPLEEHATAPVESVATPPDDWHEEVARKLEAFRSRRRQLGFEESQPELPFVAGEAANDAAVENLDLEAQLEPAAAAEEDPGPLIISAEPELDGVAEETVDEEASLIPVAEISGRRRSGLLDALFLGLTCAGFLALFRALGGQFAIGKLEAAVYVATFFLFYLAYFSLFTIYGGQTPGMGLAGLIVVGFDGNAPTSGQLLWRSFGYLVSGATLFLGFFWTLWDDDQLSWHDRISQTYLTRASASGASLEEAHSHTLTPK